MKHFWDANRPRIKNHAQAVDANDRVVGADLTFKNKGKK